MLTALLLAGLVHAPALPAFLQQEGHESVRAHGQDHSQLPWFEGTWDELLAKAKAEDKLVFVDFWTEWCGYCKKLERTTFRDAAVAKEMRDILCYSVDAEARENGKLVARYRPTSYPTLLFIEPDGELRERLVGFFDAKRFVAEVRRVKCNESTLSQLRALIEADPKDVDARYTLALKLKAYGDLRGYREQIEAIRKYDPEGTSLPSRRIELEKLRTHAEGPLEPAELYLFLEGETDSTILFEGWYALWQLESYLEKAARKAPERKQHCELKFAAARALWPNVPCTSEHYAGIGNNIAWSMYEGRAKLTAEDLAWALGVAQAVVEAAPKEPYLVDTLACCLYAVGRKSEAIATVHRTIELDPVNPKWRDRLREFSKD